MATRPHTRTAESDQAGLIDITTLSEKLSISPRALRDLKRRRKIPCVRISGTLVRYSLPAVMRALERYEIPAVGGAETKR